VKQLKDYCIVEYGKGLPERERKAGSVKVLSSAGVIGSHTKSLYNEPLIVVGRKGNISGVHRIDGPSWVIDTAYAIKTNDNVDRDYLYYFLKYNTSILAASDQSTAIPSLSREVLYSLPFAPPPEATQKKIANKISTLFEKIDSGTHELTEIKEKLISFKQSILNAAIRGKLVPQDPSDEPASKLLERIQNEKKKLIAEKKIKKEKPFFPINNDEIPFELPEGWKWVRLDYLICYGPSNGLYLPQSKYGSGTPILRIDDFQDDLCKLSSELRLVKASLSEIQQYSLQKNNLVINRVNSMTHLGKSVVIEEKNLPALFESNMMRLELFNGVYPHFVQIYLRSQVGKSLLISNAKQAVNQASINQGDVCNTLIPLPPIDEQIRIVVEVKKTLEEVKTTENAIKSNLNNTQQLKQSILKKAFEGDL